MSSITCWDEVRIGDLGQVFTGRTPSTKCPEFFGSEFPFITPGDMHQGKRVLTTARSLSESGADLLRRIQLPPKSVCVSCIGWQMGKTVVTSARSFTNQQINSIVPNSSVDADFLYYSLLPRKQELLSLGSATGVRTPILNKSGFCDLRVALPSLRTQRKIAGVLSAYDDLIENNLRRIKILEGMAQNLYREWFVKFRFPGHQSTRFIESSIGRIPEGWELNTVENTFSILGGGTPSKKIPEYWDEATINWYSPTDLTASGSMFMEHSRTKINELGLKKSSARLFSAYSVMMTSRATLGVISINTTEACTNQGFITCIPNDRYPMNMLFFWLTENVEYFISLGTGATFKEITKGVFKTIELVIPSQALVSQFENTVQPSVRQIFNLQVKNTVLCETRDMLLSKLMSSEVDVSELEIAVSEEAVL